MNPFLHGFIINFGLLFAPGAQNLFILNQTAAKRRFFALCLFMVLWDLILFAVGVFGFGKVVAANSIGLNLGAVVGAVFLFRYGYHMLLSTEIFIDEGKKVVKEGLLGVLFFSVLNPSVYVDTIGIVGALGANYSYPMSFHFWSGAALASTVWFFGLGLTGVGLSRFAYSLLEGPKSRIISALLMAFNAGLLISMCKL